MAERRRRGTGPADDRHDDERDEDIVAGDLDDELIEDDDVDTDAELDDVTDADAEFDDEDEDDEEVSSGGGGTATKARTKSDAAAKKSTKKKAPARVGPFGRLANFFREIVAELRKVIWPTRKELITYTTVVVVFVTIMLTVVGLLDLGFGKAILWIFGNKTS